MAEDGVKQTITKVEPAAIPVRLTITVDNSARTADATDDFRAGLKGLVESLPPDVEVTLIATAPQPRTVVKPTSDRVQLLKGINSFGPESGTPGFTDALVEYSERLQREAKDRKTAPYLPVLVMVSTAATDNTRYQPKEIEKASMFIASRHAKVSLLMVSTKPGDVQTVAALSTVLQALVAAPLVKATNGRYEELAVPTRLRTLLPEWGRELSALHARQITQFRVTVERTRAGDLKNPRVDLRAGLTGTVTFDGYLP